MALQQLTFSNIGGLIDEDAEARETKFEKYGAYHKTNIVFLLDLTYDMLQKSHLEDKTHGRVSLAYACLLAIRHAIIDIIKHSSLGGGGRDRVAIVGLQHNRTVVLLDMQLPSARTLETVDALLKSLRNAKPVDGNHICLEKGFDIAFTLLKDLLGDGQIFVCTVNADPCDKAKKQRAVSEETIVLSKASDLTRNHHISIRLLTVPRPEEGGDFNMSEFWGNVVSDQGLDNKFLLESLSDVAQNIKTLIRPTATTVPSGSKLRFRMKFAPEQEQKEMLMHVNLYALSRSKDFNPSKSFRVDVDDGHFLVEAKVRDGKITHPAGDLYEGRLEDAADHADDSDGGDSDSNESNPHASRQRMPVGTFIKKKALVYQGGDLKRWSLDEIKTITNHGNPRTIDVLGFIPQNEVNVEFRGQSPQYLTLAKGGGSKPEEWWTALWHCCRKLDVACLALLYLKETNSPKQILLSAYTVHKDAQGSVRVPNGFYVHYLPFRERINVEVRPPKSNEEPRPSIGIMASIEACLDHISEREFRPVRNIRSEHQWKVLEALALDKAPPEFDQQVIEYPKEITSHLEKMKALCSSSAEKEVAPVKKRRRVAKDKD